MADTSAELSEDVVGFIPVEEGACLITSEVLTGLFCCWWCYYSGFISFLHNYR